MSFVFKKIHCGRQGLCFVGLCLFMMSGVQGQASISCTSYKLLCHLFISYTVKKHPWGSLLWQCISITWHLGGQQQRSRKQIWLTDAIKPSFCATAAAQFLCRCCETEQWKQQQYWQAVLETVKSAEMDIRLVFVLLGLLTLYTLILHCKSLLRINHFLSTRL